jgi:hypothetical protein
MNDQPLHKKITNYRAIITSIAFSVIGFVALGAAETNWLTPYVALKAFISQLGGLLLATGLLTIFWELVAKREFANEMYSIARIATDIKEAGIERGTLRYLEDVEWDRLFESAHEIDIFVSYASTWRKVHDSRLNAAASKRGTKIRIFLPDPRDDQHLTVLALRFGKTVEELRSDIVKSTRDFANLIKPEGAELEIYHRKGDVLFSFYRFDNRAVLAMYSHGRVRTGVPTFVVSNGNIFDFVARDLKAIVDQSRKLTLEEAKGGMIQ